MSVKLQADRMTKRGDRRNKGRGQQVQSQPSSVRAVESEKPVAIAEAQPSPLQAQVMTPKSDINDALLAKYTKLLSYWTGGLVAVGLLTTAVLLLQWHSFEKADETSRAGLRPYISGVGLNANTERLPLYWELTALLENSGGTPPNELRYVIRSSPDLPLDPEEVYEHPSEDDAFFERSVAPKGQISVAAGAPLASYFNAPQSGWYVSGSIHYRDQFKGSEEHISKFCFRVVAVKDPKGAGARPAYDACMFWNCIDEKSCANDRRQYDKAVLAGTIKPTKKTSDPPEIPLGTGIPRPGGMMIKALP